MKLEGFKLESLTDTEINDIFETNNIYKVTRFTTVVNDQNDRLRKIYGTRQLESFALSLF